MILGIYCAGGLGKIVLSAAKRANAVQNKWSKIVFVDDVSTESAWKDTEIWHWEDLLAHKNETEVIIANGEPQHRENIYRKLKKEGIRMGTLIGPGAFIESDVEIGEGCIINNASVSVGSKLGVNNYIESQTQIGHDVTIGDHCVVNAGAFVGGFTQIENNVYIGPRVVMKDRIKVHNWAVVTLGAVVFRSVREEKIVWGNPAKVLGDNKTHRVWNDM